MRLSSAPGCALTPWRAACRRLSDEPLEEETNEELKDPEVRKQTKCTIWLSYTSNMVSCGVREVCGFVPGNELFPQPVAGCKLGGT